MKIDMEKPQYLCTWDQDAEIHTRESLYEQYKDTNLYSNDAWDNATKWSYEEEPGVFTVLSLDALLDKFDEINDVLDCHVSKETCPVVRNDNMTIQRIW